MHLRIHPARRVFATALESGLWGWPLERLAQIGSYASWPWTLGFGVGGLPKVSQANVVAASVALFGQTSVQLHSPHPGTIFGAAVAPGRPGAHRCEAAGMGVASKTHNWLKQFKRRITVSLLVVTSKLPSIYVTNAFKCVRKCNLEMAVKERLVHKTTSCKK